MPFVPLMTLLLPQNYKTDTKPCQETAKYSAPQVIDVDRIYANHGIPLLFGYSEAYDDGGHL
jgi:hypothetical protein